MRELFPRVKTLESRKCQRTFELSINLDQGLFKVCFSEKWLILYVVGAGLELMAFLLPQPLKYWDHSGGLPQLE